MYNLRDLLLILDKGFFSISNICELMECDENLSIIIPLPFRLKIAKEMIANNLDVKKPSNMFQYNEEILFHKVVHTSIQNHNFMAHIFFNEKAEVDQRHLFYSKLLSYEAKINKKQFDDEKAFDCFVNQEISENYKKYFCFDKSKKTFARNEEKINEYLSKLGFFTCTPYKVRVSSFRIKKICRKKIFYRFFFLWIRLKRFLTTLKMN
jgi:transposase